MNKEYCLNCFGWGFHSFLFSVFTRCANSGHFMYHQKIFMTVFVVEMWVNQGINKNIFMTVFVVEI